MGFIEPLQQGEALGHDRVPGHEHRGQTLRILVAIGRGALIAAGPADFSFSQIMGFVAVALASVNIFGGFLVTYRMLSMFKKKGR